MIILLSPDQFILDYSHWLELLYKEKSVYFAEMRDTIAKTPKDKKKPLLETLTFIGHASPEVYGEENLSPEHFVEKILKSTGSDFNHIKTIYLIGCGIGFLENQRSYALEVRKELLKHGHDIKVRAINNLVFEKTVTQTLSQIVKQPLSAGNSEEYVITVEHRKQFDRETATDKKNISDYYEEDITKLNSRINLTIEKIQALRELKDEGNLSEIYKLQKELSVLKFILNNLKLKKNQEIERVYLITHEKYREIFPSRHDRESIEYNDNFKIEELEKTFRLHPQQQKIIFLINNRIAKILERQNRLSRFFLKDAEQKSELSQITTQLSRYKKLRELTETAYDNAEEFTRFAPSMLLLIEDTSLNSASSKLLDAVSIYRNEHELNKFIYHHVDDELKQLFLNSDKLKQAILDAQKAYPDVESFKLALKDFTRRSAMTINNIPESKEEKDIQRHPIITGIAQNPMHPRLIHLKWLLCEEMLNPEKESKSELAKMKEEAITAFDEYKKTFVTSPDIFAPYTILPTNLLRPAFTCGGFMLFTDLPKELHKRYSANLDEFELSPSHTPTDYPVPSALLESFSDTDEKGEPVKEAAKTIQALQNLHQEFLKTGRVGSEEYNDLNRQVRVLATRHPSPVIQEAARFIIYCNTLTGMKKNEVLLNQYKTEEKKETKTSPDTKEEKKQESSPEDADIRLIESIMEQIKHMEIAARKEIRPESKLQLTAAGEKKIHQVFDIKQALNEIRNSEEFKNFNSKEKYALLRGACLDETHPLHKAFKIKTHLHWDPFVELIRKIREIDKDVMPEKNTLRISKS